MQESIEQAAAAWALRHPLDEAGRVELEGWLAADPRREGALLRAMAALSVIEGAVEQAHGRDKDESRYPSSPAIPTIPIPWPTRRRMLIGAGSGIAASAVGLLAWPYLAGERVTTAQGEIRRLPLADGSVATINTDSALRVVFAENSRQIALDRGQAWFQVVKDIKRPFIVDAGIAQVRAVGTAFSVHRTGDGVQVTVTDGVVAVWPSKATGAMAILEAGQFANFRADAQQPETGTAPAEIERSLAWRSGQISLENETLGYAVAQFNRYNHRKLIVGDADLEAERLIGLFNIDRPEDFAATLEASLNVDVKVSPTEIHLSRRNSSSR